MQLPGCAEANRDSCYQHKVVPTQGLQQTVTSQAVRLQMLLPTSCSCLADFMAVPRQCAAAARTEGIKVAPKSCQHALMTGLT